MRYNLNLLPKVFVSRAEFGLFLATLPKARAVDRLSGAVAGVFLRECSGTSHLVPVRGVLFIPLDEAPGESQQTAF